MFRNFRRFLYRNRMQKIKCCECKYKCTREMINEITYPELLNKMKDGAKLLDVRTKQEFKEWHLNNAILIPYYEISKRIENVIGDKEQTIIVYCQNGGRSLKAYDILNSLGYKNIFNLKDGINGLN